jgi:hypothetical protein
VTLLAVESFLFGGPGRALTRLRPRAGFAGLSLWERVGVRAYLYPAIRVSSSDERNL